MIQQSVKLQTKVGLYPPYITRLVQEASRFHSEIFMTHNGRKVNLKSMMGVLSLAVSKDAELTFEASGNDEEEALNQIISTVETFQ
ncbi:HPr family phosphocarrier protein [Neobacillus cucumis]|uniref:HPr family phosphocarrier protein n=1 Tax=Neobacillus cucumis TaxID=1740721 RepID=UPI0018DF5855|nr:HPr family phosphocarrier protein [Neobacillus cucumis]MBI0580785.1 HPr family phosphocarrier protein [Neobacillus cucumis]WHY89260.1 HPr family phosphocarrier protein [Neobacillus cucumis]